MVLGKTPSARSRSAKDKLEVVVDGTSITVTQPGTDFSVTYQKRFANPHLVLISKLGRSQRRFPRDIRVQSQGPRGSDRQGP